MVKFRPINETRRPDGTLTSETARRLLCRRGGLKRAQQLRVEGFKLLDEIRLKSNLMRSAKAAVKRQCLVCKGLGARMLLMLEAQSEPPEQITREDAKLLS